MTSTASSREVWRWIAAVLAGVLIAGAPSLALSISAPRRDDYEALEDRLADTSILLARLEERLQALEITCAQAGITSRRSR